MIDLSPSDLQLPAKFSSFRKEQLEAIDFTLNSTKQFTACSLPTGSGKSLMAATTALLSYSKAVYLTATRGLQSQVGVDFKSIGMTDVRGRANYDCSQFRRFKNHPATCDYGNDHNCTFANSPIHCPYKHAVQDAEKSSLVVTNYSYWLHARRQSSTALEEDGKPVELLICDEAHDAEQELSRFLQVIIDLDEVGNVFGDSSGVMDNREIQDWCSVRYSVIRKDLEKLAAQYPTLREAKEDATYKVLLDLSLKLDAISRMDSNWTWQSNAEKIRFDPIRPGKYSNLLWSNVPKVLLLSATLRPYVLSLLGIKKSEYDFREWPSSFPPQYGPTYHIPTVKLSWRSTDDDYVRLVDQVDAIVGPRRDRKGIVHTVSYGRARSVLERSRFAPYMFYNESGAESSRTVARYRQASPPAVLVSPSFGTGYDFSGDQCEYQIIIKVPFPDTTSRVMQERCQDRDYQFYLTAQQIVQMCGRGRRHAEDRCENFILDSNFSFLYGVGKKFFPRDFRVWSVKDIPKPPPKLA